MCCGWRPISKTRRWRETTNSLSSSAAPNMKVVKVPRTVSGYWQSGSKRNLKFRCDGCRRHYAGTCGGVDIPDSEMDRVRSHLAKYYRKMDRTPAWED